MFRCYSSLPGKPSRSTVSIKQTIEQKNKEDRVLVKQQLQTMVQKSFPYLAGKVNDIELLEELDYIRVMYQRPLPLEKKILLRSRVLRILESNTLSEDIHYGFQQLLYDYRCLE